MLLLGPFNFLSGNLRQANSHPLRQRPIVSTRGLFPQGPFVLIVSQKKALVLCHEIYRSGIASILTHVIGCIYSLNTRMVSVEGRLNNQNSRFAGFNPMQLSSTVAWGFSIGGAACGGLKNFLQPV